MRSVIWKEYGSMLTVSEYLLPKEVIKLQACNRSMYTTYVSRLLITIRVVPPLYFPYGQDVIELSSLPFTVTVVRQQFNSNAWLSVQVESHIFQIKYRSTVCRWLENEGGARFSVTDKASMSQKRMDPALCNVSDHFVYVSGGYGSGNTLKSVERHDISKNSWQQVPPMHVARL